MGAPLRLMFDPNVGGDVVPQARAERGGRLRRGVVRRGFATGAGDGRCHNTANRSPQD